MALIHAGSECAICGKPLDRPYTATSGCAFAPDAPLFRYCDAPLHLDCLAEWPARQEFARAYYEGSLGAYRQGPGNLLHLTESWFLACGPIVEEGSVSAKLLLSQAGEPVFAEVRLKDWPFRLYSGWREWDHYVLDGFGLGLEGAGLAAAETVMAEVRAVASSQTALAELLLTTQRRSS